LLECNLPFFKLWDLQSENNSSFFTTVSTSSFPDELIEKSLLEFKALL